MTITPLIFLDTETTGLQPDVHTPWEIAWRTASHDTIRGELTMLSSASLLLELTDYEIECADETALSIGRFHERWPDVPHTPTLYAMTSLKNDCREISEYCQNRERVPHLVGAVPSFDHAMLCRWFGWPGFGQGLWHYHLIDVENLAAGHLREAPPWSSDELNAFLGLEVVDPALRHTAMGDVDWAIRMYARVFQLRVIR